MPPTFSTTPCCRPDATTAGNWPSAEAPSPATITSAMIARTHECDRAGRICVAALDLRSQRDQDESGEATWISLVRACSAMSPRRTIGTVAPSRHSRYRLQHGMSTMSSGMARRARSARFLSATPTAVIASSSDPTSGAQTIGPRPFAAQRARAPIAQIRLGPRP